MAGLVDKKIVLEKDLNDYIQTNLEGWKKTKHDLNINGLVINTGIDGATNQITYYNIHGDLHPDGVQVIYGTHDVLFQYFTTNGLWLVTVDVETREEVQLYLVR